MPAVGNTGLTLMDLGNRMENGAPSKKIIEILNQQNEGLDYIPWVECNDGSGHKTTVRTGIPDPTWRMMNGGVVQSKSTTAQIRDACGMIENYSTVDCALADQSGDKNACLLSESAPIIEGMNQSLMKAIMYGNQAVNPEKITGLAPRFSTLTGAESKDNIIDAGGVGSNNTSIYLVVFGENSVHGLYPKGSKAGLSVNHKGQQTVYDAQGNPYEAYRTHFKWDPGFSVRDWRQVVRIANVDKTLLTKNASSGADLLDLLTQATEQVYNMNLGTPVFFANRTIRSYLRRQLRNNSGLALGYDDLLGKGRGKVLHFDGAPICRTDALLNNEARVV
jgi:hypothetical protein